MTLVATHTSPMLPRMDDAAIEQVRTLETALLQAPQLAIKTHHVFHAGMYARTIRIPAGAGLTGALIRVPTLLIVNGDVTVFIGGETRRLTGYHVLPASAGRKQAFIAHADTDLTMLFPSNAHSVEQAEAEFTGEAHLLLSRQQAEHDTVVITGESACQE